MRSATRLLTAMTLLFVVASGCSDTGEPAAETTIPPAHGRSAEWVVGGGSSMGAQSADRRLEVGLTDNRQSQVVADDRALWVMGRGEVGSCAASPKNQWNDRLSRISSNGTILDIDLSFIDTAHLSGASAGDCPTVVSGPVSAGDGAVLVTVSSQADHPDDRHWWRTYRIAADGVPELWEPHLPAEFRVVGLGRSASGEVLVIGGYRANWEAQRSSAWPLSVDGYRLFAVDPVTMEARALGVAQGDPGSGSENDPATMWMGGYSPFSYSLGLLSDGRLAYWTDIEGIEGLWIQSADGLMGQLVDARSGGVGDERSTSAAPGTPLSSLRDLVGSTDGLIEPGPDASLLVTVSNSSFEALDTDKYRVGLEKTPPHSAAQGIIDASAPARGTSGGTVLLGLQATGGDPAEAATVVDIGNGNRCVWDGASIICGSYRFVHNESDGWDEWVYYRFPMRAT